MSAAKRQLDILNGTHYFSVKEVDFPHQDIFEHMQAGNSVVFNMLSVRDLPKIWLPPVDIIPQEGIHPRLIFDFMWSGLNNSTDRKYLREVTCFGRTPNDIIRRVITENTFLGSV